MKFFLMTLLSFLLVGCGVCPSKPPKRAILEANGGEGMRYHFIMYNAVGDAKHNNITPRCTKYGYGKSHIYTDNLGSVNGGSILWKAFYQGQNSNMLPVNIQDSAHFVFGDKNIQISGLKDEYKSLNGTWQIEKSSPDSWGVPITGD